MIPLPQLYILTRIICSHNSMTNNFNKMYESRMRNFSRNKNRSSNSARINKSYFTTEKNHVVYTCQCSNCCSSQCCQLGTIIDMMYVVDQSKQCAQIYLQKITCCFKLQLTLLFFVKLIISDMHHRITYMYINFQQNRVCRSVKTVHTNSFAKYISQVA